MKTDHTTSNPTASTLVAACGLNCQACTAYIATTEDPARLTRLAAMFGMDQESIRCFGCRSEKRGPYCKTCKMVTCAAERGITVCSECDEYPCAELEQFQQEAPHRLELWRDLDQIQKVGWSKWHEQSNARFTCPECGTLNSAYDLACRQCGNEPSCDYVRSHGDVIAAFCQRDKK